jgi:hypothetical protein
VTNDRSTQGRYVRQYETGMTTTARCIDCGRVFVPRPEHYRAELPHCPTFKSCYCPCGGGAIETHTPFRRELPPVWQPYSARTRRAKERAR